MPKIQYETKRFSQQTQEVINTAESIITEYQAQGFSLTLRQLYYQFVARGYIANLERSYKRLGNIISDARRSGLIDWDSIVDRTRFLRQQSSWDNPQSIIDSAKTSYHRDLWAGQPVRFETWIEKDALVGVIESICNEYDVPFFSCRGYVSDSEMWQASTRIMRNQENEQNTIFLHLGDHDPSGIDMTRDIQDRLALFTGNMADFEVRRIALTMGQVDGVKPPPNPAKITDARFASYSARYGNESWELDALEPQYLANLIEESIQRELDTDQWKVDLDQQETERTQIDTVIKNWENLYGGNALD